MKLCVFGDSFVLGTGDAKAQGWVGRITETAIAAGRDLTTYNLGIRRNTSTDIRRRWHDEAVARIDAPDCGRLIFAFGVNDCVLENGTRRVTEADSFENCRAVLDAARDWLPTLMIGPPPTGEDDLDTRIQSLSRIQATICEEFAIPFFSPWGALINCPDWFSEAKAGDGIHPGEKGYTAFAKAIMDWDAYQSWAQDI